MVNGFYRVYKDGQLEIESQNLITSSGKNTIKQFLAGNIPSWSGAIAIGPTSTAASLSDTKLGFESYRAQTLTKTVDPDGNIVLRAAFPQDIEVIVNEIGVYPFFNTTVSGRYQDQIISDFSEDWSGGTVDSTNTSYIGTSNIKLNSSSSSTVLSGLGIDISGYSNTDKFELLLTNLDSNSKIVTLTFSDGTNSETVTFPTVSGSGLKSVSVAIGERTITTITSITIASTDTNKDISLDALKFLNTDESGYTSSLVSRTILSESIIKYAGQELEIEYYLAGL